MTITAPWNVAKARELAESVRSHRADDLQAAVDLLEGLSPTADGLALRAAVEVSEAMQYMSAATSALANAADRLAEARARIEVE